MSEVAPDPMQEDLKYLKSAVQSLLPILQDFKDLKIKKKLSSESSIPFSSLLTMLIKEEITKDVTYMNLAVKDEISSVKDHIDSLKQETNEKFEVFQNSLLGLTDSFSQTNENIASIRGHVNKFYDKFDEVQKNLDEKSNLTDINEIRAKSKQFAFQTEVNLINHELSLKAPREAFDTLEKKIVKIQDQLPSFVRKHDVEEIKSNVKVDIESYLDLNFMLQEEFLTYKDIIYAKHQKFEDDFRGLAHRLESFNKSTKENLNRIGQKISAKPWKKDYERIDKELVKLAKIVDLKDLEHQVFPAIQRCQETMHCYSLKIDTFEGVLLRYDEILLEKASKDDMKYIKKQQSQFANSEDFDSFSTLTSNTLSDLKSQLSSITSDLSSIFSQLSTHSSKITKIKKENQEISHVASTLQAIHETLSQKADKIDFHSLLDRTARKDQVEGLIEKTEVMQKQLELGSVLNVTLCRTLLGNGESSSSVVKQRQDVFRKMQGLIGWVNGEEPRVKSTVPWKATPSVRQELYLMKEDSLKLLPRTARNGTARIKMKPKRYTPRPEFVSLDEKSNLNNTII